MRARSKRHSLFKFSCFLLLLLLLSDDLQRFCYRTRLQLPFTLHFQEEYFLLEPGEKLQLHLNGIALKVTYSSSSLDVFVTPSGMVTAVKPGSAIVTATLVNRDKKKVRCLIEVASLNKKNLTLSVGEKARLRIRGISFFVSYQSQDKDIVTVNRFGVLTAISCGATTVTATACGKTFSCRVTVE